MTADAPSVRLAVLPDLAEEGWPSMELCAEMLERGLRGVSGVAVERVRPRFSRRFSVVSGGGAARNADRLWNRMFVYPRQVRREVAGRFDVYHVVDHSYSQLLLDLPAGRAGVYCHDLDTFRCLLEPSRDPRPAWFRAMAGRILRGFRRAAVVFHSTDAVREEILRHGLAPADRLVKAPPGVAEDFCGEAAALGDGDRALVESLIGDARRVVLHVGSSVPRKRLDVLLGAFSGARRDREDVRLVQIGGRWGASHAAVLASLPPGAVVQARGLTRSALAELYRRATVVAVPSEAEGFGLPVAEALACGSAVVSSDLPSLREVGGDAAKYCPVGDVPAWASLLGGVLDGTLEVPPREARLRQGGRFTWAAHAETIAAAYRRLCG